MEKRGRGRGRRRGGGGERDWTVEGNKTCLALRPTFWKQLTSRPCLSLHQHSSSAQGFNTPHAEERENVWCIKTLNNASEATSCPTRVRSRYMSTATHLVIAVQNITSPKSGRFIHSWAVQSLSQSEAPFVRSVLDLYAMIQTCAKSPIINGECIVYCIDTMLHRAMLAESLLSNLPLPP
eukprot:COSAG02_NODE_6026_length_3863_cov_7.223433_3_plen_180_part_00